MKYIGKPKFILDVQVIGIKYNLMNSLYEI